MAATRPAFGAHDLAGEARHFDVVRILRHVDHEAGGDCGIILAAAKDT